MSSKSEILDPFNTSFSAGDEILNEEFILNEGYEFYSNKEIDKKLKFKLKVRELNKLYQAQNNRSLDNGVENQRTVDDR
jgi:hypothetical protein